ncbi:ABC transporter ATP-binding protein [Xanthomonas melonis]|uniref:ABC transporter ATP-binding protein n=1 Tax=Xanthomonas melonis TaxID=56456 RepID=A0ABS8P0H9_9XANT|nr:MULTISPECIES: ABC transporter ATP-binding protein [Xanthomonas]MCC4586093.1 ABC transporter ATP-binding protein [Xanthomonas sp. NCPPB 1067]MCD0246703.1 ABC transporter ATP-binding protein [Xanthomonas melonis]MCD0260443.1 ABC transporter ATP-binding protein [Xanthomonas melonis]MCD0268647.1 ABC transporter ATP-binding protein [Xanthomonas melonis]
MTTVLTAEGLGKAYPLKPSPGVQFRSQLFKRPAAAVDQFWALRNVSFSVDSGESVGIIGRNGSGKSTLLQLVCGVMEPSAGAVRTHGRIASLLELGAGFDPEFTGRDNVFMNAALLGLTREETDAKFDEIAAFAEIGRFIDEPVKTYSSGMFVRLAFAVASHVEPEILIVDEALAVGDARFSAKCIKRIRSLRERGCTLLFVSHDVGIVRTLCDRAIWLDSGSMVAMGDVFGVTSRYMEKMFEDVEDGDISTAPSRIGTSEEIVAGAASPAESGSASLAEVGLAPINHWGSHVGSIGHWWFEDVTGALAKVIEYGETVRVRCALTLPEHVDPGCLALSISIKDLRGTDLLVLSTHDEQPGLFSGRRDVAEISFEFVNRLTEGKYLLVLALEDRSVEAIQYFEYIEGAHYFAVTSRARRFGVFNVPATVSLK